MTQHADPLKGHDVSSRRLRYGVRWSIRAGLCEGSQERHSTQQMRTLWFSQNVARDVSNGLLVVTESNQTLQIHGGCVAGKRAGHAGKPPNAQST